MTFSTVLEVGLGLILIYYVLSLIVSSITTKILEWTEMGAKDLEVGLRDLLEESGKMEEFMGHPWIENLKPKRWRLLGGIKTCSVDHIPASTFALTLFDILVPGEKGSDPSGPLSEIREVIEALPEGRTRTALLGFINSGVGELEAARKLVENWFDDTMNSISLLYKQHARRIAVIVALVVTVAAGADSIEIANTLWQEPALRAVIAAKADKFVEEEPKGDISALLSEFEESKIPILWDPDTLPNDAAGWAWKVFGLFLTWVAASQGSSFWYDLLKRIRPAPAVSTATGSAKT